MVAPSYSAGAGFRPEAGGWRKRDRYSNAFGVRGVDLPSRGGASQARAVAAADDDDDDDDDPKLFLKPPASGLQPNCRRS
jgi:hypothetical protein